MPRKAKAAEVAKAEVAKPKATRRRGPGRPPNAKNRRKLSFFGVSLQNKIACTQDGHGIELKAFLSGYVSELHDDKVLWSLLVTETDLQQDKRKRTLSVNIGTDDALVLASLRQGMIVKPCDVQENMLTDKMLEIVKRARGEK